MIRDQIDSLIDRLDTGTDLVVTHPCPKCRGVDKLACPRCDGSGRVGNRTRAEQVEAYLLEESTYRKVAGTAEQIPL